MFAISPAPFFNIFHAAAPPNIAPAWLKVPGVEALSKPKNLRNNFSAGPIKAITIIANNGFVFTTSIADPTSTVYTIKWNGCNKAVNIYSFSHALKACAFPSFILSIGYVIATNGAIIVKNIIVTNLFKYIHENFTVYTTNAM